MPHDHELIARARTGDETAFAWLIKAHEEAVFRLAYLLCGDADEAADIAQLAFIRAYKALDGFDPDRAFRPWVMQITRNVARNRRRSMARYLDALRQRASRERESIMYSAEDTHSERWLADRLRQAILHLRAEDREVIALRYFLDVPVAEAAEALEVAEGTVKSRLSRALDRLKVVIEADYPELQEVVDG